MASDDSPSTSGGKVLFACSALDAWLLFAARSLSRAGYDLLIITHVVPLTENHDHTDIMKYFHQNPFCRLVDMKDAAQIPEARYDFAVSGMRGITTPDEKRKILELIGATPLHTVVLRQYNSQFPAMAKLLIKEMMHPFLRRSSQIMVEEYINASWMLRLLTSTQQLGVVPHQRVTCQGMPEGLLEKTDRTYLFNFLGSHSGLNSTMLEPRVMIINRLEALLKITSGGEQKVEVGGKVVPIMWHADRANTTRPRPLNEYLDTVRNSYFTLCLPGYEIITHRALEAIHCGSIPVLAENSIRHYLLPLEHGRNCWAVKNDDWEGTLAVLATLDREKILVMQGEVKKLAVQEASIPSLEKKYLKMLGVDPA